MGRSFEEEHPPKLILSRMHFIYFPTQTSNHSIPHGLFHGALDALSTKVKTTEVSLLKGNGIIPHTSSKGPFVSTMLATLRKSLDLSDHAQIRQRCDLRVSPNASDSKLAFWAQFYLANAPIRAQRTSNETSSLVVHPSLQRSAKLTLALCQVRFFGGSIKPELS